MKRYRVKEKDLHIIFSNLQKAYDKLPRKVLEKNDVRVAYIQAIKDMYNGTMTSMRTTRSKTKVFSINIEMHQGSTLNPYLFILILDFLLDTSRGSPRVILFVDDIIFVEESRKEINIRMDI